MDAKKSRDGSYKDLVYKNYNYAVYYWLGDVNPHIKIHKKRCGHIQKKLGKSENSDGKPELRWEFFFTLDEAREYSRCVTQEVRSDPNRPFRGNDSKRFDSSCCKFCMSEAR